MFYNSWKLFKFIARKERTTTPIWIVAIVGFVVLLVPGMYVSIDETSRAELAFMLNDPTMIAMIGPAYGVEEGLYTFAAWFSHMMFIFSAMAVAVMSIFLVIRHTRADEEGWRYEVLRSLPIGNLTNLHATSMFTLCANVIIAIFTGLLMWIVGDESMTFGGSMLFGMGLGTVGLVFGGIAALFSQLSSTTRGALGYSFLCLGLFYMMRAAGDNGAEILSLLSPLGLAQRSQFFVNNHILPQIIMLLVADALFLTAYKLNTMRDIDQGFIPIRPGRYEAKKSLLSSWGLAWRLSRGTIITWVILAFVLAASYATILGDIDNFIAGNEMYQQLLGLGDLDLTELGGLLVLNFVTMITFLMTIVFVIPLIMIAQRLKNEEKEGRVEFVLSCSVDKKKLMLNYMLIATFAAVIIKWAYVLGMYSTAAAMLDVVPFTFADILVGSLVYIPAMLIMIGLASLLLALGKKYANIIWIYLVSTFFIYFLGNMGVLPNFVNYLSVFYYVPRVPVEDFNLLATVIMIVIAVILRSVTQYIYARRDISNI
ncbi:MAG: hypothetical protein FWG64_04965 [Firmicutes bacterium]|nr:hypothetical protein [Bacillota bacterium]